MRRAPTLVLSFCIACGSTPPVLEPSDPDLEPPDETSNPDDSTMLAELNQRAREGAVTETLHGVEVRDPYRSLEEENEGTRAWIEAQTSRSARFLSEWDGDAMRERLGELLTIGTLGRPDVAGSRVFYTKRDGDEREQPILRVIDGTETRDLVDPERFGERAALDWYFPSPSGRYVAFGISQNGDERSTLHIVDVTNGERLPDTIERTKWSTVEWLNSEDAFYYTRYPKQGEPDFDPENEDSYFPRIFFHTLGTDPATDPLVFGSQRPTDFPGMTLSDDDRWLVVNNFRGWSESDVHLFDRGANAASRIPGPTADRPLVDIVVGRPHLTSGVVHRNDLYLLTNEGAPRYKIDRVPAARAANARARRTIVAEGAGSIEGWAIAGGKLVIHAIEDVQSKLYVHRLDGRREREIALPSAGEIDGLAGDPQEDRLVVSFSSYTVPPTLLSIDLRTSQETVIDRIDAGMDFTPFTITRERVASADGTQIPITLVHRTDAPRDGERPVLLYGYGGFNISLLPSFTRNALYWMERGGVYAVANLRGGGEFGEEWHRAGNLENKAHVFEDFEASIRWLASSGWSNPSKIAITGGSNGGLLVGAMITRAPDAFGAAATYVGLYDMVRYHRFPPAELWITEYGSSENAEQFPFLHAYSPYHRVANGTSYPAILVETADHDTRVYWGHSTKFAARLQEATSSDDPILFYMERSVGHGAGTRRSDLVERYVRQYAFLEHALGMAR
jgi:prolyl oligopeptidase